MKQLIHASLIATATLFAAGVVIGEPLTVHEWGTFTAQQDEQGRAIGGVNVDDEPVPRFVHRLNSQWIVDGPRDKPITWFQGVPASLPAVTLRLETPVLYFYPPESSAMSGRPFTGFDVEVSFRGGWITEFYPYAKGDAPGFPDQLHAARTGTLSWRKLRLTGDSPTQRTEEHVWLAPRKTAATSVSAGSETEKYLFYRGVGHLDAPLGVARKDEKYVIDARGFKSVAARLPLSVRNIWLLDVSVDGRAAWRRYGPLVVKSPDSPLLEIDARFAEGEYSKTRLGALREEMHRALMDEGLFADEATAMLDTWQLSYFQSHGRRLFFTVPRAWTDHVLPISISVPHTLERAMLGRIEIVTPDQRELLAKIAAGADADLTKMTEEYYRALTDPKARDDPEAVNVYMRKPLAQAARERGFDIPEAYNHYLALGRFRDALLLDEERRRPSPALSKFIDANVYVSGRLRGR